MRIKQSKTDQLFLGFIYAFLVLLSITFIVPLLQVLTNSLSPPEVINRYGFHLFPTKFDLSGYQMVLQDQRIWNAYGHTIWRTVMGTAITVLLTFLGAYPLSKKQLPNRKLWTSLIILTMFFSGGMIPSYLLIKNLGMMDSIWSLVLPGAISTYMLLVARSFIAGLPESLEESAKIDGANDIVILVKIIIPLSMPIIATIALYAAVGHWNSWFDAMIYIQDQKKQVLQIILRNILLVGTDPMLEAASSGQKLTVSAENLKMATLMVSILPILVVYPFVQKYFVKGALIGSIKG